MKRYTLTLSALAAVTAANTRAQDWALRVLPGAPTPSATSSCRMAYDIARNVMVEFGGWDAPIGNIVFQDTWELSGANWTQGSPTLVPAERCEHMMAYDLANNRVIMVGGQDFNFNLLDEVLAWDGTNWTDITPTGPRPAGRINAGFAHSIATGQTLLTCGWDGATLRNDTWTFDGVNWTELFPANQPPVRTSGAMVYDAARGVYVMYGGWDYNFTTPTLLGDTWEFDGTDWTQVMTDSSPGPREGHNMVFDSVRNVTVLHGGFDSVAGMQSNETWEYNGRHWKLVQTANSAPVASAAAIAFDLATQEVVLFGGFDGVGATSATYTYGGAVASYRTFGQGCGGTSGTPDLAPQGLPALGAPFTIGVTGLRQAGGVGYMVLGFSESTWNGSPLPVDLGPLGLPGCRTYTSVDDGQVVLYGTGGAAVWSIGIPNSPALVGLSFYNQFVDFDMVPSRPLGASVSNAGQGTLY